MQALARLCVRRPVFASVLIIALVVVGGVGYTRLGVDRYPKVDFPTVAVITRLPGAAPEEVETEVTDKIEESINTIAGIDDLQSISAEGISQVFVTFILEKNVDVAAQEVRDKVNRVLADLPRDIDQPIVEKLDPDATPVLSVALSGSRTLRETTEFADKVLRRQLESVNGVGQVTILGGRVAPHQRAPRHGAPQGLRPHGGGRAARPADAEREAAGRHAQERRERGDRPRLRARREREGVRGDLHHAEERAARAHRRRRDRGRQRRGRRARREQGRRPHGRPVDPQAVGHEHGRGHRRDQGPPRRDRAAAPRRLLRPRSSATSRSSSRPPSIPSRSTSCSGGFLAALVVLLFLGNLRSTLIAAIAIPTSIISTYGLMYAMGFTLNVLTLLALTLAVGIVIDDAIVVLENIFRFIEEKKVMPFQAAIDATKEIGLAVLATTLSLVAVFLPVAFMGGIVGRFMNSFGLTMAFAILVSLLVSFSLTPMLSARLLKRKEEKKEGFANPRRFLPSRRPGVHVDAHVVHGAPLGRRPRVRRRPPHRPDPLQGRAEELPALRRRVPVRGELPRAGGNVSRGDGPHREPHLERGQGARRRLLHAPDGRRRRREDPEPRKRLREARRRPQAQGRADDGHGPRPHADPSALRGLQAAHGRVVRERVLGRTEERRDHVRRERPGPHAARRRSPTRS